MGAKLARYRPEYLFGSYPKWRGYSQWGFADGDPVNKKYTLTIDDKGVAAELFRKTNKVLTITGLTLDPAIKKLGRIDARHMQFVRAVAWAEDQRLIAITEIEDVTYLRLTRPSEEEGED